MEGEAVGLDNVSVLLPLFCLKDAPVQGCVKVGRGQEGATVGLRDVSVFRCFGALGFVSFVTTYAPLKHCFFFPRCFC